ncbi:NADH:ubiquinone reductase (H(+)-translocating) [Trifolium repens]|nr:NADH:ubiquinone reductase (H(+)-translocating) [Trifolium repens]
MAARSSNEIIQEPYNPSLPPIIDLNSDIVYEHHTTDAGPDAYDFFTEKFVDFESLKANGIDIQYLFDNQKWQNYFEMLNGFVYYDIVKYFWQKAKVYDRESADKEYKDMVEKNKELRGKTRKELGLKPYRGREIRSNILGINVVITQAHIAKILGLDNKGEDIEVYDKKSKYLDSIHQDLFKSGCSKKDFGKIMNMKHTFEFAFRMCLSTIFTRKGGLDTISIPHRHFIWFLFKRVKVNLAKILFDHMCLTINEGRTKIPSVIHHPRLISELIRQTKLTDIVSAKEKLRVFQTAKYDASVLVHMKRKTKEEIISVKSPLQQVYEKYFWCDGFPTISEHDNDEVIKNFLESVRRDTGVSVPRKMVVSVPNWDIFKGPREITRNRRKPRTTEQEMIDEGSDDQGHISADEIEEGAGDMMTEDVQKEKWTKKRHDRPSASEEDQNLAKPAKKLKVRASKPKGKISESNTSSIPVAQVIGSEPQPSIAKPSTSQPPSSNTVPNQTQPIDYTVPLSVVLPSVKLSSSSSSDTSTASDELIATLIRESNLKQKKTLTPKRTSFKKTTKKTTIKPIHLSSDEEPTIYVDTTILNQPTNQDSVLEHLEQHMCGVAFTNSNPNSPPQFPSMNLTNNSPVHETQNTQVIHTPPPSLDHISHVNPPTFTPIQNESIAHSEEQQKSPHSSPINVMTEQQHQSPPPEVYSNESSPSLSPPPVYGPLNKPLVLEEVLEIFKNITEAEHQIFKDSINLDDDIIPPNLSKIKIINLKRKQPEPTIPFDPSLPFFNSDSEPNLELLHNAIGIRLKRFKQREEEALIFPSDIDADVRELEYLFGKSLKILSTHLKDKIKGRGANTVRELFEIVEKLNAPRLTSYNHDNEQARIAAEVEKKRLEEIEYKRLAVQEALRVAIEMGTHIATVETNKILSDQAVAEKLQMQEFITVFEQGDTVMADQSPIIEESDKGKKAIVDTTPPISPKKEKGSPSSNIDPAVQKELDSIRTDLAEEIRNEIDELRIDLRTDLRADLRADFRADITASEENTRRKMDEMMATLLQAIKDIKKP